MRDSMPPVLRLQNITKRFGTLVANDDISLDLDSGEVLALLGENGAGKSTLVSILFGHYRADSGHIEAFGQPLPPGNPRAALAAGIGMVHQHFTLADNLSVLDNVLAGSERLWQPFSRRAQARHKLLAVSEQFGLQVQPEALVGNLSVGERQRVEILKALYRGARILILDEPTAVLTPQESEALFATLAQMVAAGLSIIFISHKLPEVLRVSHRVAVLRGGKLVATAPAAGTTQAQLALWMVGRDLDEKVPSAQVNTAQTAINSVAICSLDQVHTTGRGHDRLNGVSLQLQPGCIVAIAGVSGNGQVALAELLCGMRAATSGMVTLHGQALKASPAWLVARGVARIPEDRHAVGVVGDLPVWENAVSERLRSPVFSKFSWIRRKAAMQHAGALVSAFDVRGGGLHAPARALSGGNMQKLILGRALMEPGFQSPVSCPHPHPPPEGEGEVPGTSAPAPSPSGGGLGWGHARQPSPSSNPPRLIVAHQPTWGLDVGAVAYVQQQLRAARDAGAAVLLISDDLDEVLAMGDQVAVMHGGHLTDARPASEWTRESMGLAMAGVA